MKLIQAISKLFNRKVKPNRFEDIHSSINSLKKDLEEFRKMQNK